jgi:hypothetical protein
MDIANMDPTALISPDAGNMPAKYFAKELFGSWVLRHLEPE